MTEQTNTSPAYLVRVTHPDEGIGVQQVRLDAPEGTDPLDAARHWLADAHNDLRYLDADAQLVESGQPDPAAPVSDSTQPGEPADITTGPGATQPPAPPAGPAGPGAAAAGDTGASGG